MMTGACSLICSICSKSLNSACSRASTVENPACTSTLATSGVRPGTVRLSVGTESVEDLIWDLQQGFALVGVSAGGATTGKKVATP